MLPCCLAVFGPVAGCSVNSYTSTSPDAESTNPAINSEQTKLFATPQTVKLRSGKQVTIFQIRRINLSDNPFPAIRFTYLTDLSVKNKAATEAEATQVWDAVRDRATKLGFITASVGARERVAFDKKKDLHKEYGFGWRKDAQGNWNQLTKS